MADLSLRPRSITEIVDAAFRLYRQHFVGLVTVSALVFLPMLVIDIVSAVLTAGAVGTVTYGAPDPPGFTIVQETTTDVGLVVSGAGVVLVLFLKLGLWMLWGPAMWASILVAFSDRYLGRESEPGAVIGRVLEHYGPVTGSYIVKTVLSTLGLFLLIVPGVYFYMRYFAVPATAVMERNPTFVALERSATLARGMKGKIFGALFMAWFLFFLIVVALAAMIAIPFGLFASEAMASTVTGLVYDVVIMIMLPFLVGVETLLYYDARIRQEGYDIQVMTESLAPAAEAPTR